MDDNKLVVIFVNRDGSKISINCNAGETILSIAHTNNIALEGVCGGCLSCSTCHVIVDELWYDKLPSASDAEEDMLDMAEGLTKTSRLGCQIVMTENISGIVLYLPR